MSPFLKPVILPLFFLLVVSSSLLSLFFLNPATTTMTTKTALIPPNPNPNLSSYHDWDHFAADYLQMTQRLKLYAYPELNSTHSSHPFAKIFLPLLNPYDPKLGNYFSEHMFKISLLRSPLLSLHPASADFFFLPFSVNALRNDPRVRTEAAISAFVAGFVGNVSRGYGFWNASSGADHFYVHCHSVGRDAASRHFELLNNAVQVACSASYFQRLYVSHKDVALPQVWPRKEELVLIPPSERYNAIYSVHGYFS